MTTVGFWRDTNFIDNRVSLVGYGQINRVWYLFPQGGGPRGAFTTFTDLKPNLRDRDLIFLSGVLREQAVAPDGVFDVTIVGAANTPRQATSSGTPTGGGASWLAPTSPVATTPLLEITRAGWSFENIQFSPTTSSAAVRLTRSGTVDLIDASHARFENCYFLGGGTGQIGIEDNGGCGFVEVNNCRFQLLTGTACLSLNTAAAVPLGWAIESNRFQQNTNDIKMSLSYAIIRKNRFLTAGSGATNKVISTTFIAAQGGNNLVTLNHYNNTAAQMANASGYTGAASDSWSEGFCTDAVDYGVPA